MAGIGFAFGMERMIMLMGERTEQAERAVSWWPSGDPTSRAGGPCASCAELRSAGIRAEASFGKSFKAQMRRADRSGYPSVRHPGRGRGEVSHCSTMQDMSNMSPSAPMSRDAALDGDYIHACE
ncbi:MAG: hypothetical protein MZV70_73330 [Desulfobacterales bacterium]|nr:hypothetical protein [Desulfobacterales bacterium]